MSQGKRPTILLIEREDSLRRLISLGLQNHEMYVVEASTPATIPSFDTQLLDLLVIDVDQNTQADWSFLEIVCSHSQLATLPTIVLAWEYPSALTISPTIASLLETRAVLLTKPFDARALQEAIEQFLKQRARQEAVREAHAEKVLLASYAKHAAPSIWPVVTAGGLLLAVIGLLMQFVITALGLLIVLTALILWNVGVKNVPNKASASA